MSRKSVLLGAVLIAVSACATPQQDTTADAANLRAGAPEWFDFYNAGNAAGVAALYAEDGVLMPPGHAAVEGREAIERYLTGDIAESKAGGIQLRGGEVTGIDVSGDLAWLTGTFAVMDATGATVDRGKYVSVYRRDGSGWKLIRDTWNSDTAPAAATPPATTPATAAAPGKSPTS